MEKQGSKNELFNFFIQCLQDLYCAEKKSVKCFTALSIASVTDELRHALNQQSEEAENHLERLNLIFMMLEHEPEKGKCDIIERLSERAAAIVKTVETGTSLRDAEIIYAVQLIIHYKIASYGSLGSLMADNGYPEAEILLNQSLADEKNSDAYLTQIAMNFINPAAKKESE